MFECVQGEGGVIALEPEFVKAIAELSKEKNFLIIVDEVQTGNGRTGRFYGYMNYGINPDVVTTAKGLGGGLPIGAAILGDRVENVLGFGDHGSTYGGNPVCAAGALSVVNRIDDTLLTEVTKKSEYIFETLKNSEGIKNVTGMGLMIGIETEKPAAEVVKAIKEACGNDYPVSDKVRLLPALNIPFDELKWAIDIIKEVAK